ncbi:glycine-rich protein [Nannocystis sp.]|uniref:glycine-rich protein n=1 Tax=Nannocystis sp. TaxID=1962667 RepID=UPI0025DC7FFA|nr:glycine-rich protein [Nannocystis sp.]MBK7830421.1 hypothetical protein [Nannocystis sp.]
MSLWSALTLAVMVTGACSDDMLASTATATTTTTEEPMCQQGEVVACYPGPEGTADVGTCVSGTQTCEVADGVAMWSACAGFVLPADDDICNDGIDNDCDGHVDVQPPSLGTCAADPSTPPPICTADQLKPDLTGLTKATAKVTGYDQVLIVPNGVQSIWVKLWGAHGGRSGGGGGFALAKLDVIPGERLTVIVGQAGQVGGIPRYGGGGGGGEAKGYAGGSGGGRSALRRGPIELVTAAGGGGDSLCSGMGCQGGAGGGAIGEDGADYPTDEGYGTRGFGATPNCGGDGGRSTCGCPGDPHGGGGLQFQGGSPSGQGLGGGGGGGGWFGGGAGSPRCDNGFGIMLGGGGGGGGSSHVNPEDGCVVAGAGSLTANTVDIDYDPEYDGSGRVVVYY